MFGIGVCVVGIVVGGVVGIVCVGSFGGGVG